MPILLAGDVGGTKTLLGLFDGATSPPSAIRISRFATLDFADPMTVIDAFLEGNEHHPISTACLGVAGPVRGEVADLTNVDWHLESREVSARFGIASVFLLNDVTAMAYAVPILKDDQLAILQTGDRDPRGNAALIAPGTGVGEALLHNVDGRFVPVSSEGGHADFAARTRRELKFVETFSKEFGRVSYEHVVSGPGLINLHRFAHRSGPCPLVPPDTAASSRPALIASAGMNGRCAGCVESLEMFVDALGAEAGNLGLRSVATAGVYLGGGIPPKILDALRSPRFLSAFRSKHPMSRLVEAMPVAVVVEPDTALLGAAIVAQLAGG